MYSYLYIKENMVQDDEKILQCAWAVEKLCDISKSLTYN